MREIALSPGDLTELSVDVLRQGGSLHVRVHGSSMWPFVRDGDRVMISPVCCRTVQCGAIVLYETVDQRPIIHRVIRARHPGNGFLVRGDAHLGPCEPISAQSIIGRVETVQRRNRVIELDRPVARLAAWLWIATYPLGPLIFRCVRAIRGHGAGNFAAG